MAAVTICSDFGAQKYKVSHCFHCFPVYLPWSDGTRCHDLSFLTVEFLPTCSLSSFTFIKRFFSFSSLSAIRVVSSAYIRLLIFLLAVLIPACNSSSLAFRMICSGLNKVTINCLVVPFLKLEPVSCFIQVSNCCFLTHVQVSQAKGKMVWYPHLFKSFL